MPIALADLLDPRQIALRLSASDMAGALGEILQLLAANGKLTDPAQFLAKLLAHEQTRPATVDAGIALSHLRTDLVKEVVIGIGRSKKGIPLNGGAAAKLIFVIAVPQRFANEYLIVVGGLARLLREESIRKALLAAKSTDEFVATLLPSPEQL